MTDIESKLRAIEMAPGGGEAWLVEMVRKQAQEVERLRNVLKLISIRKQTIENCDLVHLAKAAITPSPSEKGKK